MYKKKKNRMEEKILKQLSGKAFDIAEYVFGDNEIKALQDYANIVSIKRLGYNDHGPVHMRKAALNAVVMFDLLKAGNVKFSLEKEEQGTVEDSKIAVFLAAILHDVGMTISRTNHEFMSVTLAAPIIERILEQFYHGDLSKRVIMKSLIIEGIFGHMATQPIHSLEAGLVLVGDGCDMEKGRARITTLLSDQPKVGDIHKYSSTAIQNVQLMVGEKKPIRIHVQMKQSVGFFQVEEVLYPKIAVSPVKKYIELVANVEGQELKKYL